LQSSHSLLERMRDKSEDALDTDQDGRAEPIALDKGR